MIMLKATELQRNFDSLMEQTVAGEDVVIEQDGSPCAVIINDQRYQRLLDAERARLRLRLQQASAASTAAMAHLSEEEIDALIEEAREEAYRQRLKS